MIFGGLNGEPRLIDGEYHGMCEAFTLDWYRRQLDDALTLLASKGAVVFVTPFAYSESTARPDADRTADCLNPVIRAAVAANPDARLIPLDTYVCSSPSHCKDTVDGVKLRWDGLHYRDHAAEVVDRWLLDQVFARPVVHRPRRDRPVRAPPPAWHPFRRPCRRRSPARPTTRSTVVSTTRR